MITLDSTLKSLEVKTDATATTTESVVVAAWADITTTTFTPGETDLPTNGTTAVTAAAAPGASTQRQVKFVSVYNADTVVHTITVQLNNNSTKRIIAAVLLSPGQTLQYSNGAWTIIPTYLSMDPGICEGRLTLTTGVPVTTSDVTGATSIFWTPYKGNRISLYTNSAWTLYTFTEKTLALGTLTSGLPYDVFAYDSGGAVTLELLAWTSGTARATALVLQDGVLCKSGALTRRYLGTFYTTATTTTEDSVANRYLWNYYNRVRRKMVATDATTSWSYSTNTWRQARATATNQLNFIVGKAEVYVQAITRCVSQHSSANALMSVGVGVDVTNANSADITQVNDQQVAGAGTSTCIAQYESQALAEGKHFLAWIEMCPSNAATGNFFGGAGTLGTNQSGIIGSIDG